MILEKQDFISLRFCFIFLKYIIKVNLYDKAAYIYIYKLAIACQTAEPKWLNIFLRKPMGTLRVTKAKKSIVFICLNILLTD